MFCQLRKRVKMTSLNNSEKLIIGQKFKTLRVENNYTQKELGELIGVSFQTIQKYEKGLITPNLDIVHKYSTVFAVKSSFFLDSVYPINTGEKSYDEQAKEVEATIFSLANQLRQIKPSEIPVFAQRDHSSTVNDSKAMDHIFWSKQRINNRNLFVLQVQTNSMYPTIVPNDRLLIDPDLEIAEGIGLIEHGRVRKTFKSVCTSVVRITRESDQFFYSNNRQHGADISVVPKPLKKEKFLGMAIQVIRSLDYHGSSQAFDFLPIPTENHEGAV